jgi:hypothetical protein
MFFSEFFIGYYVGFAVQLFQLFKFAKMLPNEFPLKNRRIVYQEKMLMFGPA